MKKFCPKTLYLKPCTLSPNFGFTLIELLVVVGIIVLLVSGGVAAYNNFNQNQILAQATATLRTNLRDAQNRALSGEKDCSAGVCGGVTAGCGNDSSGEKPLDGWRVEFLTTTTPHSYRIYGVCGLITFRQTSFSLPNELDFSTLPPSNRILFKSLTHGTDISGSTIITLRHIASSRTQPITVTASGEIK
jgi:prepilin-type N-terminal cleavage/methylation domain-containing protein